MTETKEGGAPTAADAPVRAKGVGFSSQDPVELPDLRAYELRAREIQRLILALAKDIPQNKKSVARNVQHLTIRARKLVAAITMNEEVRVHSESVLQGVEFTEDLQKPNWCSHETEGF